MSYKFTGKKFTGFRSAVDIAKDIRKDIKQAVKDGTLPADLKVSVRSEYYAGGQSINIRWSSASTPLFMVACHCMRNGATYYSHTPEECHTGEWREYTGLSENSKHEEIEKTLKSIGDSYNYDDSDPQSDYFSRLYYCWVDYNNYKVGYTPANIEIPTETAEIMLSLLFNGDNTRRCSVGEAYEKAKLLTRSVR